MQLTTRMHSSLRALALVALLLVVQGCAAIGSTTPARATTPTARAETKAFRASIAVEQDFGLVYGGNVCAMEAQVSRGFACFRANRTQYHGTPLHDEGGDPAEAHAATTRLLAGLDYVLLQSWTLGVRGGLVLRGGSPKQDGSAAPAFMPFHGELRATRWFGTAPLGRTGFRWGAFIAGGIAQVDAAWRVRAYEDNGKPAAAAQPSNPEVQTIDAYQKSGTGFVGGGAAMACSFNGSGAFFLDLKLMQLFPSSGTALAPAIGYEHAF